jgi:hypothetical protein
MRVLQGALSLFYLSPSTLSENLSVGAYQPTSQASWSFQPWLAWLLSQAGIG